MNSIQNSNANSNSKGRSKKRRNRNNRCKNPKIQNGHDNNQINIEKRNCSSRKETNPPPSTSRPTDFNNLTFENKRCSGSEYEEFHTPLSEYPDASKNEIKIEINNSAEDEWDEIARFSKSSLEGIPEQDYIHNHKSHFLDGEKFQIISSNSYKSKPVKNKKNRKQNGQKNFQYNETCTNINTVNGDEMPNNCVMKKTLKEYQYHEIVNGNKIIDQKMMNEEDFDYVNPISENVQSVQNNSENDDHKQNESEENEPSICSVIEISHGAKVDNLDTLNNSVECVEDEVELVFSNDCLNKSSDNEISENQFNEKCGKITENQDRNSEINTILVNGHLEEECVKNEESVNTFGKDDSFVTNDFYFDEKIQEIEEYSFNISTSYFENEFKVLDNEDILKLDKYNIDLILSNESELENIHCTDENLDAEILQVPKLKFEFPSKPSINKSMTLRSRDFQSSHRHSTTTITDVTSISDEHVNINYETEFKTTKNNKKRSKLVKIVLSKLKKRKVNTKIEKTEDIRSSTEDQLVENNEYFDDASIDCNSHAKGQEIDSNKALKSYDESINNYGDAKHNEDLNEYENNFFSDNENKSENIESVSQTNIVDNFKKEHNKIQPDEASKEFKELGQSNVEKESERSHSVNCNKPEKAKKNKMLKFFHKKNNNGNNKNDNNNNNKLVPKFEESSVICDLHKSDLKYEENKDALANEEKLIIETNHTEDCLNNQDISISPGEPLKSDIEALDQSFRFLNSFETSPIKEKINIETCDSERDNNLESDNGKDEDIDFYLCANIEDKIDTSKLPSINSESPNKFDQIQTPQKKDIVDDPLENEKPKEKSKKKFWTLFLKRKKKQSTVKARRKSWSYENIKDDNQETKEPLMEDKENKKSEDQHFSDFKDVYNSLNPQSIIKNETVVSKNKNDFPRIQIEDDITDREIEYINDDHLFPDSITPTKITHLEPGEPYSFAFIDDPVVVEQDKLTMFKGENKKVLLFSEFYAPFASLETLFKSETSDDIEMSEEYKSPARISKRPFSGLLGFLSRYR